MKGKIKKNLCFIAAVTVLLLSIDFVSAYLVFDNNFELCCNCPDFSKHSGHSHNHSFEDEVFCCASHSAQHGPEVLNDFIPTLNLNFTDSYCSKVWQPPKNS